MSYIASPATRAYAGQQGVDLDRLAAQTGRETLAREDIDGALEGAGGALDGARGDATSGAQADHRRYWNVDHAAHGPVVEEAMPRIAQLAAANLAAAHAMIPQVTHHDRAVMRAVETFRARLRDEAKARGIRLTALAFHVKVLARCLREFPRFNASLNPGADRLILKDYVHVGIAVDSPHGLMVPVIRDADRKGLWRISSEIADLAARGQTRRLRSDEMGGASMSISNLGGIGGTAFTPIVNPPEVAILGLTRTETVPVWQDGEWQPVPMVPLDLSYDHRVINGADAARFVARYCAIICDLRMLLT